MLREKGSTTVQMAIATPIFFGCLFMFQDAVVLGYNWVAIQRAASEGARYASLGHSDGETQANFRLRVRDRICAAAAGFNVADSTFMQTQDTSLYTGSLPCSGNAAIPTPASDPTAGIAMGPLVNINFGDNLRPIYEVQVRKTVSVTPVTGVLFSLAGGGSSSAVTLSATARARVEKKCDSNCSTEL